MKKSKAQRLFAFVLMLVMVLGAPTTLSFVAKAETADAPVTGGGSSSSYTAVTSEVVASDGLVTVPAGVPIWNGIDKPMPSGAGTETDPYLITSFGEFMYFRESIAATATADTYVRLVNDIAQYGPANASGHHLPAEAGPDFAGVFDGNGHIIYNLRGAGGAGYNLALFGTLSGTVKNLNIHGCKLVYADKTACIADVVTGSGIIDNVHVKGAIGTTAAIAIKAEAGALISDCSAEGMFTGGSATIVGGLLGEGTGFTMKRCVSNMNYGSNTISYKVGGLVGLVHNGAVIEDCTNNSNITSVVTGGGIVAYYTADVNTITELRITNCVNNGNVTVSKSTNTSQAFAGGIVGRADSNCTTSDGITTLTTTLVDCVNHGNITAKAYNNSPTQDARAGGMVGSGDAGSWGYTHFNMTGCISDGTILANKNVSSDTGAAAAGIGYITMGWISTQTTGVQINAKGCLFLGSAGGGYGSGGIVGYLDNITPKGARHADMTVNHTVVGTTLLDRTCQAGGPGGAVVGWSTKSSGGSYLHTLSVSNSILVENSNGNIYNATDISSAVFKTIALEFTPYEAEMLTNNTAKDTLNKGANTNGTTPWIQGATAPVYITEAEFSGATMTLGENMMLNLKLNPEVLDGTGVTSVTFVRNGEATPGNASVDANGYYTASFACDAADLAKSAAYHRVFTAGGNDFVGTNILNYAPVEYATALYNDKKHPETQDVIKKMLSMASLSEKAKYGAESNAIATAASNVGFTLPTEYTIPEDMKYYALDVEDADAAIAIIDDYAMTGANLNGSVNLVLKVTDASITKVVVTSGVYNETFEVKDSYVTITGLGAKHIANLITIAFHNANGLVASTNFSVGNYLQTVIANAGDDTATKNLASAMVLYMVAVRDYALNAESVPMPPPATVCTVTFDSAGGTTVSAEEVIEGGTVIAPAAPTREGYTFVAWMLDGVAYDFETPVTEDITLVASWEENPVEDAVTLHKDFVGGNIRLLSQDGDTYHIQNELRDSDEWMYWAFCVEGAAGKTLTFTFDGYGGNSLSRIGYWGPAVSSDLENWDWLGSSSVATTSSSVSFTYTFAADEDKVYFAHNMLYLPQRFEKFAAENGLVIKQLCESAKGRSVPYVTIGEGEKKILIVTRQHSCESTGSFVMEGILRELLEANLPANVQIIAVPFVDYDGVIEGDQGKNQGPHDPNRDWFVNKTSIYPEVAAIKQLAIDNDILFAFDLHSPWHWGGANDVLYGTYTAGYANYETFWSILDGKMTADAMDFNTTYNTQHATAKPTVSDINMFRQYMEYHGAQIATVLEIPFFGLSNEKFSNERGLAVGRCFAEAILECLPLHTVTILDKDGGTLEVQIVGNQLNATLPVPPVCTGFVFDRWSSEGKNITQDTVIQAIYVEVDTYTVTFYDKDGTVLSTQTVNAGESATAPEAPDYENFIFLGWDNAFENVTSDINVTAQYKALSDNASTMNVLQWQQNKEPNFRLELVGEKDIILYTSNIPITSSMIPEGWEFVLSPAINNNSTPTYQAVIFNPTYYTYDETAETPYVYMSPIEGFSTTPQSDGSAVFAVPLTEGEGTENEKQFVMTIFVVNGGSRITNEAEMKAAMSCAMNAITQEYPSASGIVVSLQANTWDDNDNTGHYASGYFSDLDNTAFVDKYNLVCHYEAVTKETPGISRDYATYLLTYMKEGQIVKINSAETVYAADGYSNVSLYNGLHSSITFDTEGVEAESD